MKILVTGGAGFIGSNLVRFLADTYPLDYIVNLDALTYAGNRESVRDLDTKPNYQFVHGDVTDADLIDGLMAGVDAVMHLAAESHVDRSISDPGAFVRTNVVGSQVLLEAARRHKVGRFLYVSTDEVMGSLGPAGLFDEETPLAPNSPYSASKAGGELLARAFFHTYGLETLITRCSNNYGPYQFPEKLIPFFLLELLDGGTVPLYGDGLNVRDWLYVEDHCRALDVVLRRGTPGQVYCVGGNCERTNAEITHFLLAATGRGKDAIRYVQDRPGHDRRYAIDAGKIKRELGWEPAHDFQSGMTATIAWYNANAWWWRPLRERALDPARAAANQQPAQPGVAAAP
ncbi:MAG: dTDP-glucose 4,6-dehydratase [Candidatus Sericytochromatia bacterium]|nr:dTDP-glucose 4,6-dehydratase [Candidatus Tanganyikabacteria bacterium]